MNKKIVLDFQGFKDGENEFIIKELAGFDGCKLFHFIFEPPYAFTNLTRKAQSSANWLIRNHHKLNWELGFVPYQKILEILTTITSSYDRIYMKGREKSIYIKKLTKKAILELPEYPPLKLLQPECLYHNNNLCICALTNVKQLYQLFVIKY